MRKIILLLLTAVCLVFATHAQRYQVTTGTSAAENQWAVVEDPAIGGYVEIGNVTIGAISQLWISSYAPNGTVLTSNRVTNNRNMIARDISIAPLHPTGNTYYVTGWTQIQPVAGGPFVNQMFVGRINLAGVFIWYQEAPFGGNGNHKEGVAIVTEPATGDAVALGIVQWAGGGGFPAGPRVFLTRFTPPGGILWTNTYNLPGNWMPREIDLGVPAPGCAVAGPPGNFIVTGEAVVPPVAVPQTFAAVYNGAGIECWRNLYPAAAPAIPTPFGDAGYDVVFHPQTGNYCVAGVAQTGAVRAAATSTPYFLNITPAGVLVASSVYSTPALQPLGLYPRCISLGPNPGQVVYAGPDFGAGRTFWGMLPGIAPFPAGPLNNYAGLATANSVAQPFVLNDAWPEDILYTALGTIPGYLVSTNAVPGAFGAGDGHFIRTNLAGQTPDSCRETRKTNRPNNSLKNTPQNAVVIPWQGWGNVPTILNKHNVQQQFCRDTCFVNASYTYMQTGTSVSFTSTSTASGPMVYSWDFGDGSPLDPNPNPVHNYTGTASYYVACLTVTTTNASGISCSDKFCDTIFLCSAVADFNYSVACKTATFTNTSTGTGTLTYSWDFGDGGTSTATNPSHTYTACGNYTVRLITCDAVCCDTIYKNVNIPCCALKSDFCLTTHGRDVTLNINTGSNPAGTTYDVFVNTVPTPWANGTTQTLAAGTHTICVKATYINACGDTCCVTTCKTISVSDLCTLAAGFWFQVQSNGTVAFSDQTTGGVSNSYLWDFGDGNTSTTASPTHTYTATGTFTACLTVTSVNGSDTCRQYTCKTVVIDKPCVVFADYTATHCTATPFTVTFKNLSINATSYEWNFGDGSPIDLSTDPTHTYAVQGTYIVCLKAIVSSNCWYTACYQVIVSTTTSNTDCNNLPANPLFRMITPVKNEMKLLAVNASPGIIQKEEISDKTVQPGKVEMFPNPASQQVRAVFVSARAEKSEVMVLNAAGKLVYKTTSTLTSGKNQLAIPVNNFPDGIYLVRIQTGAQTLSGNFFVNNR